MTVKCNYEATSMFRTADWRFQRAREIFEDKSRITRFDDEPTRLCLKFLKAQAAATTPRRRTTLQRKMSDLCAAYEIYTQGGPIRDEMEARLIAGESFPVIAGKTRVKAAVICTYEQMFFEVAKHLKRIDWLLLRVIRIWFGLETEPTEGQVWKYMALANGPVIVDILVADFHGRPDQDVQKRHQRAERARFMVRDHAVGLVSGAKLAKVLEEGSQFIKLPSLNEHSSRADQYLHLHMRFLRYLAGLPPQEESPNKDVGPELADEGPASFSFAQAELQIKKEQGGSATGAIGQAATHAKAG